MTQVYKPQGTEINAPTTSGAATTVGNAKTVRAVNTATSAHLLSLKSGTATHTMSLAGGETVVMIKDSDESIFAANAAVKLTKVTRPRG